MATPTAPPTPAADKTSVNVTLPKHIFDHFKNAAEDDMRSLSNHLAVILTKIHKSETALKD